jgi:hypothetical protein
LNGRILRVRLLFALVLLAFAPCHAEDLVFPPGKVVKLSGADKRAYARLDFVSELWMYPAKIEVPNKSSWEVPAPQAKKLASKLRNGVYQLVFPTTIYVPAGEYVLSLRAQPWVCSDCDNSELGGGIAGRYSAPCSSHAVLEPAEMTLTWKAEADASYEITSRLLVPAPKPWVQWREAGVLAKAYSIVPASGSGVAKICVTQVKVGGKPAADSACQNTRYSLVAVQKGR